MSPGSSMLLCAHSAALCGISSSPTGEAVQEALLHMGVKPPMIRRSMPKLDACEAHGLIWQIHRDGKQLRAFACGPADRILPICSAMQSRQMLPISDALRQDLLTQLTEEHLPPLCFAMADYQQGMLGKPVYLGAFLFQQKPSPDAIQ